MSRRLTLALLSALGACLILAPQASATQFGDPLVNNPTSSLSCLGSNTCTSVNKTRSNGAAESGAPFAGILTSVLLRHSGPATSVNFLLLRPGDATDPNELDFTNVGPVMPATMPLAAAATVTATPQRRQIQKSDRVGITVPAPYPPTFNYATGATLGQCLIAVGPIPVDASTAYSTCGPGSVTLIAATVEADADGDGFGDETQDGCPANSSTQGACPPQAKKKKKCKKGKGKKRSAAAAKKCKKGKPRK